MKTIAIFMLLLVSLGAHADINTGEIKTRAQADEYLEGYCIVLVDELRKSVKKLNEYREAGEWKDHGNMAAWISGVADVYSKLCK